MGSLFLQGKVQSPITCHVVLGPERKPVSEVVFCVEFYRTYNHIVQVLYWFLIMLYFDITLFSVSYRVHKILPFLRPYTLHTSSIRNLISWVTLRYDFMIPNSAVSGALHYVWSAWTSFSIINEHSFGPQTSPPLEPTLLSHLKQETVLNTELHEDFTHDNRSGNFGL